MIKLRTSPVAGNSHLCHEVNVTAPFVINWSSLLFFLLLACPSFLFLFALPSRLSFSSIPISHCSHLLGDNIGAEMGASHNKRINSTHNSFKFDFLKRIQYIVFLFIREQRFLSFCITFWIIQTSLTKLNYFNVEWWTRGMIKVDSFANHRKFALMSHNKCNWHVNWSRISFYCGMPFPNVSFLSRPLAFIFFLSHLSRIAWNMR